MFTIYISYGFQKHADKYNIRTHGEPKSLTTCLLQKSWFQQRMEDICTRWDPCHKIKVTTLSGNATRTMAIYYDE